jgi:hypothetical protein
LDHADIVGPRIVAVSGKDVVSKYNEYTTIIPVEKVSVAFGPDPLLVLWEFSR